MDFNVLYDEEAEEIEPETTLLKEIYTDKKTESEEEAGDDEE